MMVSIPGMSFDFSALGFRACESRFGDERTGVRLDCGRRGTQDRIYFCAGNTRKHPRSWRIQGSVSNRQFRLSPARSVAGLGVVGLLGACPGISSGIFPGSS
jgi:hypothetical protein